MNKKINVLVFPCGAENALNVVGALRYNLHFEVFGATSKRDHSEYVLDDNHLEIGDYDIRSESFFDVFNNMLDKKQIDYIIPTHDEIILFLVENQDRIHATVVASPSETCRIAYGKVDTLNALRGAFYLPDSYDVNSEMEFPVFVKPNHGAGGKGARIIKDRDELLSIEGIENYLISEYLPGEEYTIDCFTNKKGELLFVGPRTRERITTGISFRSRRVPLDDDIQEIAEDINRRLRFRGLWFFQLKRDKHDNYKLMEISVRCAGTMDLYRELGVNFPCLSLFDFMGYDVSVICNNYGIELDRYYKCMYKTGCNYEYVYMDFDDTIVIDGKINLMAMSFLYQCLNRGVKVILLTKHSTDIYEDLKKYKIDSNLFYEIKHINDGESKMDYIDENNAIFVDNYFPERKEVFENKKIPVFDVDAIESLILDR